MLTTRQRATAAGACLFTAAALTLTACSGGSGGSGDSDSGTIDGAEPGGKKSPAPSASPSLDKDAPAFDLPKGLTVRIEAAQTGDTTKDELLRDIGYSVQARVEGFAKGDGKTPNINRYFAMPALSYWGGQIEASHKKGRTVTGEYHFYGFKVSDLKKATAAVRFCEDQRKAFGKEIESNKVLRTTPSDSDFIETHLQAAKDAHGDWQVRSFRWDKGVDSCKLS